MKTVLVTGAAGLIGSHLVDELLGAWPDVRIVAFDDLSVGRMEHLKSAMETGRCHFVQADVCDDAAVGKAAANCDVIVHLAAKKKIGDSQTSVDVLRVNATGTLVVLEAAKASGARLVLGSTSDCYGMLPSIPFREDDNCLLGTSRIKRWAYATSKLFDEQLAFGYHFDYGVDVVVLRYFGGFSERSSFSWSGGHIPVFIDAVLLGREAVVHGDGEQARCMGHAADLARATGAACFAEGVSGEVINVGNSEECSVIGSVRLIHRLSGMPGEPVVRFVPMKELFGEYVDVQRRVPDLSKAKRLLNYSPRWSFEAAIKATMDLRKKQLGLAP